MREPFLNNRLPREQWDPVAARVIDLYPLPNGPGEVNNFTFNPKLRETADQYDTRWDHRFSGKDTLFGRFSFFDRDLYNPAPLPAPAFGVPEGGPVRR